MVLGDIAAMGLTLAAGSPAPFRPDCQSCRGKCHLKGWRAPYTALFGEVRVKLLRLACAGCGCGETGVNWPSHCRSTPGLDELQARLSALMPYRVAADLLQHVLPIDAGTSPETLRSHTLQVGKRLGDAAAEKPPIAATEVTAFTDGCPGLRAV